MKKLAKTIDEIWSKRKEDSFSVDTVDLRQYSEKLTKYADMIDQLNGEILSSDSVDDDEKCMDIQEIVWEAQSQLSALIEKASSAHLPRSAASEASRALSPHSVALGSHVSELDRGSNVNQNRRLTVKIPKLDPVKFNGDPMKWQEFWDYFQTTFHETELSEVDKLKYLRHSLVGDAKRVVEGFRTTAANYDQVIEVLQNRFGDTQLIVFKHLEHLINLPAATMDISNLQSVYDECEKDIRSLVALGLEEDTFGLVFTPLILSKMPTPIQIELNRKNASSPWDLGKLRETLRDEIKARQMSSWLLSQNHKTQQRVGGKSMHDHQGQFFKSNRPTCSVLLQGSGDRSSAGHSGGGRTPVRCLFCREEHFSDACTKVTSVQERKAIVLKGRNCFRCLGTNHRKDECKKSRSCYHCGAQNSSHHPALCLKRPSASQSSSFVNQLVNRDDEGRAVSKSDAVVSANEFVVNSDSVNSSCVYAQYAEVQFPNLDHTTRVYLDGGGTATFITEELAREIKCAPVPDVIVDNARFEDEVQRIKTYRRVKFDLPCLDGTTVPIVAHVTKAISRPLRKLPLDPNRYPILKQIPLADPLTSRVEYRKIDMLIGLDHYNSIVGFEQIALNGDPAGLRLLGSKLGYIASGPLPCVADPFSQNFIISMLNFSSAHQPDIERFWQLEDIGIKDSTDLKDDELALDRFHKKVSRREDGRIETGWPWKSEEHQLQLSDNRNVAMQRFRHLDRSLRSRSELKQAYHAIIEDQVEKGVIETAPEQSVGAVYYMPHHCVVKTSSSTTKVRVVYDASSKANASILSLNESLLRGPVFLGDLCGLQFRFRLDPIAFTSDIEKAFLQVGLTESDRDTTRFFWYKDLSKPLSSENVHVYRFARVPFGVISSPFLLSASIKYHLNGAGTIVADRVASSMYVDNVILGCRSTSDAKQVYRESKLLFSQIRMNLREWFSNDAVFMETVAEQDRGKGSITKVLGMLWDTVSDTLYARAPSLQSLDVRTKRQLVQAASVTFDPCGLFAPVVVRGKLIVQDSWELGLRWDTVLPKEMVDRWEATKAELVALQGVGIPRYLDFGTASSRNFEIHCFCDASKRVYGACVYLRSPVTRKTHLIFAKTRLKPMKPVSIPRLELMAAVVGVRLIQFVLKELVSVSIIGCTVWVDSKSVIEWLRSPKVLTVFVENRIRELRSTDFEFRHVPRDQNPADIPSKGVSTAVLRESNLWWRGPLFLQSEQSEWPNREDIPPCTSTERRSIAQPVECNHFFHNEVGQSWSNLCGIDPNRSSSLSRLLRVTAWVLRFINNLRSSRQRKLFDPVLSSSELAEARHRWLLTIQEHLSKSESYLATVKRHLRAFVDASGLVRVMGRLRYSDIHESSKAPILLPKSHPVTRLIIKDVHDKCKHSGHMQTLSELRTVYWVPSGISQVKSVLKSCVVCRIWEGGHYQKPEMPDLPEFRVSRSRPFASTGVDYIGPLFLKDFVTSKAWICLFTCACTRAVHLEVITSLSTEHFLLALRRFMAVYGRPDQLVSDNGGYFKLASSVLERSWRSVVHSSETQAACSEYHIRWKFIPEHAPWMGGFYERLVGLVKRCLRKVLGKTTVSLLELQTTVAEIASILNERPLFVSSTDTIETLSPANLLGRERSKPFDFPATDEKADPDYESSAGFNRPSELVKYWKSCRNRVDQFWVVWRNQYLNALRERNGWKADAKGSVKVPPAVGHVVLIGEKLPRSRWKVGVVEKVNYSSDNEVRSCLVRVKGSKHLIRPLKDLYPIEMSSVCSDERISVSEPATNAHPSIGYRPPKRRAFRQAAAAIKKAAAESESDGDD